MLNAMETTLSSAKPLAAATALDDIPTLCASSIIATTYSNRP
jgi:hypothetical protein